MKVDNVVSLDKIIITTSLDQKVPRDSKYLDVLFILKTLFKEIPRSFTFHNVFSNLKLKSNSIGFKLILSSYKYIYLEYLIQYLYAVNDVKIVNTNDTSVSIGFSSLVIPSSEFFLIEDKIKASLGINCQILFNDITNSKEITLLLSAFKIPIT
jgi:ribosomal protein L5